MTTELRHVLLKCKLNGAPEVWEQQYRKDFQGVNNYPKDTWLQTRMGRDLQAAIGGVSLYYLGYSQARALLTLATSGTDVFVAYFTTEWWKNDKDDRRAMDKAANPDSYDLYWFSEFRIGLFLALLTERWDDIAAACDWVEPHLNPEFQGEGFQYEIVSVYKLIAASLRPRPMEDKERLQDEVLSSKHTRPKFLLKALMAAESGNQKDFEQSLLKSLARFRASKALKLAAPDWIADAESVVAMTGLRLGMKLPELTPEFDAVLVTRQSLGLE